MKGFCPLASGSKGNSIFFGTQNTRILIDAGIRTKTILERLDEIGVEPDTLQAILITHEHSDHIAGLAVLAEKLKIPVLANAETAKGIVDVLGVRPRFRIFATGESFCFGDLEVHPFSIPHDTLDPVAFTIQTDLIKVGICADLGHVTSLIRKHLEACDYLYLESNHQPSMVHSCARPQVYKTRVLGKQGHLSNEECGKLLASIYHAGLKHVHLAHLSSECNTHEVAMQTVKELLKDIPLDLSIAYQDKLSKPIHF
jgi:phosphoribosyl 1,2-cyclic phosphodiesterase